MLLANLLIRRARDLIAPVSDRILSPQAFHAVVPHLQIDVECLNPVDRFDFNSWSSRLQEVVANAVQCKIEFAFANKLIEEHEIAFAIRSFRENLAKFPQLSP